MGDTRSIDLNSLDILQGKMVFPTSNNKHVLSQDYEMVIREPEYKLLGFLNNYSYSAVSGYLAKDNLEGDRIAEIYLEVDHGYFYEGLKFMYFIKDKTLYCIDENLDILWQKDFDDYIRSVTVDIYGSCYILFKNSRLILKYLKTGEEVLYLLESEDVSKVQRLYTSHITAGSGYLYVIGSSFYDYNQVTSFIDLYDTRKGELIDHQILFEEKNVKVDDPYYEFYNIRSYDDNIYIYGKQFIKKVNIKMVPIWEFNLGYNSISRLPNDLSYIEYDDSNYEEKLYFTEDLYDTKGHSIGLLSPNGKLIWKLENQESSKQSEFNLCIYKGNIFATTLQDVNCEKHYLLSINDNSMYLQTHDNHLIKAVECTCDEMFIPENYFGQKLVGSKIKAGIQKELIQPILHDSGPLMVDEEEILLSQIINEDYTNPENYEYFYLLSSERLDKPNDLSILTTLNGSVLTSYFGSAFKTKEPYVDYTSDYEGIADDEYNAIETMDGETIVRKTAYYSRTKYLLADRYKFRMAISTKKNKLPIATKKFNFVIARKARYVYKYVLKKLSDIDIISEFLEQNNIVDTLIPYYVDKLRHHTTHMIEDMQTAGVPHIYDIMPVKRFSYKYDGYEYPIRTSNTQIYMVNNMPFIKKRDFRSIFIDSMANLVTNKEVRPFILFIGGRAIKWSDMVVVRDWYYTYIIIKNIQETDHTVESIIFPCNIRYGEDNNILPNTNAHLYFDKTGCITENKYNIGIRIEVIDPDVSGQEFQLSNSEDYFQINTKSDQISSGRNIIVFENNKLFGDSKYYLQSFGKNAYKYVRNTNPLVKTFYYNKANDSKNLLLNIPNQEQVNADAVDRSKGLSPDSAYMDSFNHQFDFKLSKNKTYAKNIAEATSYILSFNTRLLIDYYKDQANFKSYTYTGDELYDIIPDTGGWLNVPRQRKNGLDDFVIVFHNDKLYEYYREIKYDNRSFRIPIFNYVNREDKLEVLHFRNIDNTFYTLTITKDEPDYIAKPLRNDNFLLFGNSPSGKEVYDDFNKENNIQYELGFEYKNNWNGDKYISTEIKLNDEYYYGKKINIVAKRQFRHMYYHVQKDTNVFNLNPEFRFCRNENQYLVFVDGIKLINDDFGIEVMTNSNQIDMMKLVTTNKVTKGSYIHIIYIPDAYNEILIDNHESKFMNGDINLDISELDYPFDKDLFMISIDGNKINNANIQNISSNRVRLTHMDGPFNQICINSFMKPDAILKQVFSYGDSWSSAVDTLSKEDYIKLFKNIKK